MRNHSSSGNATGGPKPFAVVELPARDPVEDWRVLDRVGIADLMRPDEERFVVLLVARAPDDAVERPLTADGELERNRSVDPLNVGENDRRAAGDHAPAAEVRRRRVVGRPPAPRR